jgi:hypothetical protein
MPEQTPQQALDLVANACIQVQADLPTHQRIQQALKVLQDTINPEEKKKDGKS